MTTSLKYSGIFFGDQRNCQVPKWDGSSTFISPLIFSSFTEVYRRPPGANGDFSIYTSLYDPDRSKSANPNVYFYKTAGYPTGFIY